MMNSNKPRFLLVDQHLLRKKSKHSFRSASSSISYSYRLIQPVPTAPPPPPTVVVQSDQYKVPFFHLYETVYKFRHSIINLLEQNKFLSLADRLDMIKQLSSADSNPTNDFVDNSERVLKDTVKVLQTCMATMIASNNEVEKKSKETVPEQPEVPVESSNHDQELLQEKELIIEDLNHKNQAVNKLLEQSSKKHEEDVT